MAVTTSKPHPESPEGRQTEGGRAGGRPDPGRGAGGADKEAEQGFRGVETDPTPNENYTVAGVTSGAPTPETDKAHAEEVRQGPRRRESAARPA
jgi:hypothetical protein